MSTALARPSKTLEDYLALPDDVRAELIEGNLYVSPAPSLDHQHVVTRLGRFLDAAAEEKGLGRVWVAPVDVILPTGDVVQPDMVFVRMGGRARMHRAVEGVPDLVVEVVSAGHAERDRLVKRRLYEANGVPVYWIFDVEERSVEVLEHDGASFRPAGFFVGGTIRSALFPGLELELDRVFPPPGGAVR